MGDAEPGNPEWGGAVTDVGRNTASGITWTVTDAGEGGVDAGEVVWSGTVSCELCPEDGTDIDERGIRAEYLHTWGGGSDGEPSVTVEPTGALSVERTPDDDFRGWSSPVVAWARE